MPNGLPSTAASFSPAGSPPPGTAGAAPPACSAPPTPEKFAAPAPAWLKTPGPPYPPTGPQLINQASPTNDAGPALHAERLTVDGGLFFTGGFTATGHGRDGTVRLLGAHISGQLRCTGAVLTNDTGPALHADGLTVDGG